MADLKTYTVAQLQLVRSIIGDVDDIEPLRMALDQEITSRTSPVHSGANREPLTMRQKKSLKEPCPSCGRNALTWTVVDGLQIEACLVCRWSRVRSE